LINKPQRSLHSGDDFGKYKILKFLGCGGMGEVYLAHDSILKRKVALKLLPPNIAADANRIRRFQIEARAASRIVQRNVAQVYEVGETESIHFIAMEFIDGETLRTHLKSGSLSSEQVLPIAKQIAAALQAAHEVGVVHRDLKPENIMLRSDGEVKVLDFSLAKLTRRAPPSNGSATDYDSSFLTNSFKTEPGFLMGTATYMSPEQARGQEVDVRTDVWSFGVVLYEMLKGEPPFRGATGMDTIVALLTTEFKLLDGGADETYMFAEITTLLSSSENPAIFSPNLILRLPSG
jgi:serine/threonine protein kinase